jgi:hypothetical protein
MINEPLVKSMYCIGNTRQPLESARDRFCWSSEAKRSHPKYGSYIYPKRLGRKQRPYFGA